MAKRQRREAVRQEGRAITHHTDRDSSQVCHENDSFAKVNILMGSVLRIMQSSIKVGAQVSAGLL